MKLLCPKCRAVMFDNSGPTYNPPSVLTYVNEPDVFKCRTGVCDWKGTAAQAVDAAIELSRLAHESQLNWAKLGAWLNERPGAFKPEPKPEAQQASPQPKPERRPTANSHQAFSVKIEPDGNACVRWFVHNPFGDLIQSGHAVDNHAALNEINRRMK